MSRTHDLTALHYEKCACGRTLVRMDRILGRCDDMLIIRGVNVFPSQIEDVILKLPEYEPHFLLTVDRVNNTDTSELKVEVKDEYFTDDMATMVGLQKKLESELRSVIGLGFKVKLVEPKGIERSEGKAKRVIDKRFKNAKKVEAQRDALQAENEQFSPLLDALKARYGTDEPEELLRCISQPEQPADEARHTDTDNAGDVQPAPEAEETQRLQAQIVEHWQAEAQALKDLYPAFSLEEEIENDRFAAALQNGMSVRDAYQYAHFDEILSGAIQYTAEGVKNSIQANRSRRSARPAENGTRSGAAALVKSDIGKLTKQEMEEIDKRVLRGERIIF